jgi:hypothetical protein
MIEFHFPTNPGEMLFRSHFPKGSRRSVDQVALFQRHRDEMLIKFRFFIEIGASVDQIPLFGATMRPF